MPDASSIAALPEWARSLLVAAPRAHLGLLDEDGHPRVQPITYSVAGNALATAVDHKPKRVAPERLARIRWLTADPRATITADRYDPDWRRLAWVQALGTVSIVPAAERPDLIAALQAKYPQYVETPPAGPILLLVPARLLYWRAGSAAGDTTPGDAAAST